MLKLNIDQNKEFLCKQNWHEFRG